MGAAVPQVVTESSASGAQVIDSSLKFDSDSSTYLSRTPTSTGNRNKYTWSGWVKRTEFGTGTYYLFSAQDGSNVDFLGFEADKLMWYNAYSGGVTSADKFRDPSGWYHIVFNVDSTQATAADRVIMYVNGRQVTSFSGTLYPSQNRDFAINYTVAHSIGYYGGAYESNFYLSNVTFIDGQTLTPESFGYTDPLTNTWRPKKYEGTFGTNGVYLPMDGNSPIGEDKSGIVTINNGSVWSSSLTSSTGFRSSEPAVNAFDGSTSTVASAVDNGVITFTSPVTFPSSSTIKVYLHGGAHTVTVNGGSNQSVSAGSWQTLNFTNSSNSTSVLTFQRSTNADTGVKAIEIDGVVLVDGVNGNSWTPVNFGGSVSLDNPIVSGARPILNTDGGGNVARPGVFGSEENLFYTVTTANGSVYQFDITSGNNPSLSFIRGATYRFDYTSHSSHPLRFSSTNPDSSTSAYTDGTNTSVSNVITITVPHNAPNTLYYYCTAHASAMNGSISVTTDETKADPYAWKNVLALPLIDNGAGGTTQDFSNQINAGSTTKASTTTGSTDSTSIQSVFYNRSFVLDGNGDDIRVPDTADFTFGSGDFTIEGWAHQTANSSWRSFVMKYTTNNASSSWFYGFLNGTQYFYFYHGASAGVFFASSDGTVSGTVKPIPLNTWVHCAVTRSGNVFRMFENGVQVCTMTVNETNNDSSARLSIGQDADGNYDFAGYFSDVRVYKGVAKYTSNFVVPATSPDILPDTPSGVSGSSKLAKVTDGAVSFDGSGDYLSLSSSSDLEMGTGDFTIEMYVYSTDSSTDTQDRRFFATEANATSSIQVGHINTTAGIVEYADQGNANIRVTGTTSILNKWTHVAVVRNSGTVSLYIDGKSEGTPATDSNSKTASTPTIGKYPGASGHFKGFLSNIRVLKGTALYTANFTPPTRELTNVTNTKLLCCQSNKAPGDATIAPLVSGVNSGTNWSAYLSGGGGFQASYPVTNAFNGVTTGANTSRSVDSQTTQTFTPPGGISYSSSVEVWTWMVGTVSLNGGSNIAVSNDQSFRQIASGSGTIDSISFTSASGNNVYIAGIKVDGTILVDPITPYGNAAANNFNPFTTDINAVRGQETGYCTFNVLRERSGGYNPTFKDGNLFMDGRGDGTGTLSAQSGKFYFEVLVDTVGSSGQIFLGVQDAAYVAAERGWSTAQIAAMRDTNTLYGNGATGSGVTYGAGDLMSFAFDADNNKLYIAKNGVYMNSGVPSQGTGFTHSGINFAGGYTPIVSDGQTGQKYRLNCGQKPFKFPPPAGFSPINGANIRPETVIARSDHYVRATIYTGNNGTNHKITSGIDADLVWIKNRSSAFDSALYDTIRISDGSGGDVAGSSRSLSSNRNLAQGGLGTVSLLSDGFNLHYATANFNASNNYVAWSWRAGGSKNTFNKDDVGYASAAAAGLDGGSLAVTGASVGTKQGFSIIKFASGSSGNKTLSHGLLETPTFILVKTTGASSDWSVYHKDLGGTVNNYLVLNSAAANATASNIWGAAVPTSSVFGINPGTTCATNQDVIAYLWHDVPGLQKFGKYDGNNNANGPFIELGFRPTLFVMKQLTGTGYWMVYDSARDPINNGSPYYLFWNADSAQGTGYDLDFLSNGVKLRTNNANFNSSTPYVYMAWAESPTFNLFGAQSNAR